jgi:hypothetical protein
VAGETEYAFRHILVRDVAYGQIPRSRRGDKHRAAAEWIESLGRSEQEAELLAHHYLEALEYAKATGQDPVDLAERGRLALRRAGERAFELTAFVAASRFYDAALELWPREDPERAELLLRAGEASWRIGGDALDRALEARDLLTSAPGELLAEVELLLTNIFWYRGDRERSSEHLRLAGELADRLPASRSKVYFLTQLSRFHMLADENERAIAVGLEGLEMAEALKLEGYQAAALNNIGAARANSGDPRGVEDLERSVELATKANDLAEHARSLINLGVVMGGLGRLDRAKHFVQASLDVARAAGDSQGIKWCEGNLIRGRYWQGEWDESIRLAESFIRDAEAGSVHYMAAQAYYMRSTIRLARGDPAALADAENAIRLAHRAADPQVLFPTRAVAGHVFWEAGEHERAEELLAALLADAERGGSVGRLYVGFTELAWLSRALDRQDELIAALSRAAPSPWVDAASAVAAGELVEASGIYDEIGARPEAAYSRLRSGVAADVAQALEFYRSVGAVRYIHEGEQLLAATA